MKKLALLTLAIAASITPAAIADVFFTDNFSNSGPAEYDVVTPALVLSARIAF